MKFLATGLRVALIPFLLVSPSASLGVDTREALMREFFAGSKSRNLPAIEKVMADRFQSVHTDCARDRAGELEIIRNIKLEPPTFTNFQSTRNGSALAVAFQVNAPGETLGGKRVGAGSRGRMADCLEAGSSPLPTRRR